MAHIYNSQLDAFELYHLIHENEWSTSSASHYPTQNALPALGHAVAGAVGSAISNVGTYPLDLIITRLQIQQQLRKQSSAVDEDEHNNVHNVIWRIYEKEEGVTGFYTGLLQDTGKTIADSFLFFLAYNFLRQRRVASRSYGASEASVMLPVFDELRIGFIAGALAKFLTTPISNIVTRKQISAITSRHPAGRSSAKSTEPRSDAPNPSSAAQIAREILHQKGIFGFWSGYSAVLVLALNPSLTFCLFETVKRLLLPRSRRDNPPPVATFLMAAISKACASSVTYPFSVAKARAQSSPGALSSDGSTPPSSGGNEHWDNSAPSSTRWWKKVVDSTIFATFSTIVRSDDIGSLYSGVFLELVKSSLSHGTTMIVKQYVHRFIIRAYYISTLIAGQVRSRRLKAGVQTEELFDRAREQRLEYFDLARRRAVERVREGKEKAKGIMGTVASLGGELMGKANETADLVADYVEEETGQWKNLDGTGLARWFDEK